MQKSSVYRLLAPGPVPIPKKVLESLSEPALHHRIPAFEQKLQYCFSKLKEVFETKHKVLIHASTGSGAMESAIVNCLKPGDKGIFIVGGKFGERWAQMAKTFGAQVVPFHLDWGEPLDLNAFENFLKDHKDAKVVATQACETSTATLFPVEEISRLTKQYTQALVFVDAITAMGCMDLPMDAWNLDVVVAGSQKAFMLPTGLSFVGLSEDAEKVARANPQPRYYFDWVKELESYPNTTRFSSPNSLIVALYEVLHLFEEVGMDAVKTRCRILAETTRLGATELGLKVFSKFPSSSVTAIELPEGVDGQKLRSWLETEKNITVMGGQDQLKGKVLRVGHMGAIYNDDLLAFFDALMEGLNLPEPMEFKHHLSKSLFPSLEYFA